MQIRSLTGIRFVFAMMVLACHGHVLLEQAGLDRGSALWHVVKTGYLGVQFFFVLSGFILTYTYCGSQAHASRASFWNARVARIYPVYLLGFLLMLPIVAYSAWKSSQAESFVSAIAQLTLTQAWFPRLALTWNTPGWSLSVEAFFYLVFPFLLPRLAPLRTGTLVAIGLGAFAASQSMALVGELSGTAGFSGIAATEFDVDPGFWALVIGCNPLVRLPEFVVGAVAGLIFLRHANRIQPYARWLTYGAAAAIALILLFVSPFIPVAILNTGGLALLAAALFVGLAAQDRTALGAILSTPTLVLLGEASYGMYILHYPIRLLMWSFLRHFMPRAFEHPLAVFAAYTVIVIVVSLAVFQAFEKPMRAAIRDRLEPRAALPATSRAS